MVNGQPGELVPSGLQVRVLFPPPFLKGIIMGTSKEQIRSWLLSAKQIGATHGVVVCDSFEWEDYPIYVTQGESVEEIYNKYDGKNMQMVMEVYDLNLDIETQLKEKRSINM